MAAKVAASGWLTTATALMALCAGGKALACTYAPVNITLIEQQSDVVAMGVVNVVREQTTTRGDSQITSGLARIESPVIEKMRGRLPTEVLFPFEVLETDGCTFGPPVVHGGTFRAYLKRLPGNTREFRPLYLDWLDPPAARVAAQAKINCISNALPSPWEVVDANVFGDIVSVTARAESIALGAPHRSLEYEQQRYVELTASRFPRGFPLVDPDRFPRLLRDRIVLPLKDFGDRPAAAFAPLVPYANGGTVLFVNARAQQYCELRYPAEWPNPFGRCQLGAAPAGLIVRFPADAVVELPSLVSGFQAVLERVRSCH